MKIKVHLSLESIKEQISIKNRYLISKLSTHHAACSLQYFFVINLQIQLSVAKSISNSVFKKS